MIYKSQLFSLKELVAAMRLGTRMEPNDIGIETEDLEFESSKRIAHDIFRKPGVELKTFFCIGKESSRKPNTIEASVVEGIAAVSPWICINFLCYQDVEEKEFAFWKNSEDRVLIKLSAGFRGFDAFADLMREIATPGPFAIDDHRTSDGNVVLDSAISGVMLADKRRSFLKIVSSNADAIDHWTIRFSNGWGQDRDPRMVESYDATGRAVPYCRSWKNGYLVQAKTLEGFLSLLQSLPLKSASARVWSAQIPAIKEADAFYVDFEGGAWRLDLRTREPVTASACSRAFGVALEAQNSNED